MRICVFLKQQDVLGESAPHRTSRDFAALLVRRMDAHKIGQDAIQLCTAESWQTLKARYRREKTPATPKSKPFRYFIPAKLPPAEVENCKFIPAFSAHMPSPAGIREGWDMAWA